MRVKRPLAWILALPILVATTQAQDLKGWPAGVREIRIRSTADHTDQPALAWSPAAPGQPRPLLVGLHTWSGDYRQAANGAVFARWAMQQGWHFVYPDFRGANKTSAAMGSDLAVQDIVDAVEHLKRTATVDEERVYLIGVSGGGHMALLMAGRHPEIWAGVSAWCGISDIAAWHAEHLKNGRPDKYGANIEACLGGPPDSEPRLIDARKRSPLFWLASAQRVPLDINHGIHDGRSGSVPFRHSLLAFNRVAAESDRLPEAEVVRFYETQQLPDSWAKPEGDPLYGTKTVRFRHVSGNARVTVFEGGHEILYAPSLNWLALQRRGQPAVWVIPKPMRIEAADTKSGL